MKDYDYGRFRDQSMESVLSAYERTDGDDLSVRACQNTQRQLDLDTVQCRYECYGLCGYGEGGSGSKRR